MWTIRSGNDYWSNNEGWTEYAELATVFTDKDKEAVAYLPIGDWPVRWEQHKGYAAQLAEEKREAADLTEQGD